MVVVKLSSIEEVITSDPWLSRVYSYLLEDVEVRALLEMSNVVAVNRLKYNDHGPVHARLTASAAVYLLKSLVKRGVAPSALVEGVVDRVEYAYLVPLIGGLLHDVGNSVHRYMHEATGLALAKSIVDRALREVVGDELARVKIRQEILHSILCTAYDVDCLTVEAGCVKVGDGLDMAEGRARLPYKLGGVSIHSISALSIERVEIVEGSEHPIRVNVYMSERSGIFQVDEVLLPKIRTTPLRKHVCVYAILNGEVIKAYSPSGD